MRKRTRESTRAGRQERVQEQGAAARVEREEICAICQSGIRGDATVLPACSHVFCAACISQWPHLTCPTCRAVNPTRKTNGVVAEMEHAVCLFCLTPHTYSGGSTCRECGVGLDTCTMELDGWCERCCYERIDVDQSLLLAFDVLAACGVNSDETD